MYALGLGVLEDYTAAHVWFNIAAANGDTSAIELMDEVAQGLTPADLSKAQALARRCLNSNYQDCP